MKVGKRSIKMEDGSLRRYASTGARDRAYRYMMALKHGFKPKEKK